MGKQLSGGFGLKVVAIHWLLQVPSIDEENGISGVVDVCQFRYGRVHAEARAGLLVRAGANINLDHLARCKRQVRSSGTCIFVIKCLAAIRVGCEQVH